MRPGRFQGRDVTIQDVFEAVGAHDAGTMSDADFDDLERHACPGAGACGGQFTANTMATVCETLGISPFGSAQRAGRRRAPRRRSRAQAGALVIDVLRRGLRPRQILTRDALENAIAAVAATGGSTNAVLHLLAIASEAGVALDIDDFDRISAKVPLLADLKPGGRFVATDLHRAGGIPLVVAAARRGRAPARRRHHRHRPDHRRARARRRSKRRARRWCGRWPTRSSRPAAW